jgi:hypothetical protein
MLDKMAGDLTSAVCSLLGTEVLPIFRLCSASSDAVLMKIYLSDPTLQCL